MAGIKGVPTTTVTPTTLKPKPVKVAEPEVYESPTVTMKPVYIVKTEVRVMSKTIPNGPWSCMRTFVYSDGKRTSEYFKSPTECSQ